MRLSHRLLLHGLWIATALRVSLPSAADPDLWGHLLFGRLLLSGTLPTTNGFAYTAADHPWINHELLAETAMAGAYALFGGPGLVVLKVTLVLVTLALVWRAARRRSNMRIAAAIATCVAALIMAPGLMIRPQLFTLVGLALALDVLAAARYRAAGAAWLLPLLVVVWINTHGGVVAGIGLVAIGLLVRALALPLHPRRAEGRRALRGAIVLIALLAVPTLMNPYGLALPLFLASKVTPQVPITEWAPVSLGDASFPLFKAVLIALLTWLALARRARAPETAIVLVTAAAALVHRRHIPLFAVAAAPLIAAALADVAARLRTRLESHACGPALRAGVTAIATLQMVLAVAIGAERGGRVEVDPRVYPTQALRFLAQNGIRGQVALPFDWGEVALWSLPPGSSIAVDGRFTTAYPQEILDQSWRFMTGGPGWDDLLVRHPTDIVMSARWHAPARLLRNDPEWEYVYSDPVSVVFIRRVASQAETLMRFYAGTLRYDATPLDRDFPALAGADHREVPRAQASSATVARAWSGS